MHSGNLLHREREREREKRRERAEERLGRCQNRIYVLNSCKVALDARQYNERDDGVLKALVDTVIKNIAQGMLLTADQ